MRRITLNLLLVVISATMLQSCYSTRLYVGDVQKTDPLIKVNKEWNHHLLFGLVPLDNSKMRPSDYVNDTPNYVVKTNTSFANSIVSSLTFGLYSPTQTTYYVPLKYSDNIVEYNAEQYSVTDNSKTNKSITYNNDNYDNYDNSNTNYHKSKTLLKPQSNITKQADVQSQDWEYEELTTDSSPESYYVALVLSYDMPNFSGGEERMNGFTAGFLFNHSITKTVPVYFSWGLLISGCFDNDSDYDYKYNYFSASVPVGLSYKYPISNDIWVVPSAGLNFRVGTTGSFEFGSESYDLFEDSAYKRFTMGGYVGANIEFNKILIGVNYNSDFMKIMDGSDTKYNNISLRLGFKF
ncbi:MAG: hypothetical protein R3Y26_02600 [Rikenellaceae bacterium]